MYSVYEKLRDDRGVTDYAVSKATGLNRSVFTEWRRGTYSPKRTNLEKIADYFDVPVEYLITGKHPEHKSDSGTAYYFSDETAAAAQEIFGNPALHALLDAARGVDPGTLKHVENILRDLKGTNPDG